jgi:hypothetical protein
LAGPAERRQAREASMKNITYTRTIREPLADDPTQHREVSIEVSLPRFVSEPESVPESEKPRYEALLRGWLQLECEVREAGLWAQLQERSRRSEVLKIKDPWDRLSKMDKIFKRLLKGA